MSIKNKLEFLNKSLKNVKVNFADNVFSILKEGNQEAEVEVVLSEKQLVEKKAFEQLINFANSSSKEGSEIYKAIATPDFHPGTIVPVGTVLKTSSNFVIPQAIGTDINCGMRVYKTNLTHEEFLANKKQIIKNCTDKFLHGQRNIPLTSELFKILYDNNVLDFLDHLKSDLGGIWSSMNKDKLLREVDKVVNVLDFKTNSKFAPEFHTEREGVIRDPQLGTIGSGNHFLEFQRVSNIFDKKRAFELGIKMDEVLVAIHTGSREVGFYVGNRWIDVAKNRWIGKKPESGIFHLLEQEANNYLEAMGVATNYAFLNRIALGEMLRQSLDFINSFDLNLVLDVSHNVITQEQGFNIHRKGATPALLGQLGFIPGSMGSSSYLVEGLGNERFINSCSHGAGRNTKRGKSELINESTYFECITLKKQRIIEEAPNNYKDINEVIRVQEDLGMIHSLIETTPLITFKA